MTAAVKKNKEFQVVQDFVGILNSFHLTALQKNTKAFLLTQVTFIDCICGNRNQNFINKHDHHSRNVWPYFTYETEQLFTSDVMSMCLAGKLSDLQRPALDKETGMHTEPRSGSH